MMNEHGLECPIQWEDINPEFKWVATDANGEVFGYSQKPILRKNRSAWNPIIREGGDFWAMDGYYFGIVAQAGSPDDVSKCLWERPKTDEQ